MRTGCCVTMYSDRSIPPLYGHFAGKWNGKRYQVLRQLGQGANGAVYLVSEGGKQTAVKVGADPLDLFVEVNMLRCVQKVREASIGPLLCDVDDLVIEGRTYPFYSMEYLDGERLDHYVERKGTEWVPVFMVQLLGRLHLLHQQGWAFGDIKPENLIITREEKQLRLIDFGGVTRFGNAIRQFTEEYDRGAWKAGDRRAEASYDLFAVAVMMIKLMAGKDHWQKYKPDSRNLRDLYDIILENENLAPFRHPLVKALRGACHDASGMRSELLAVIGGGGKAAVKSGDGVLDKVLGGLFVGSLLLLAGTLYYVWV